MSLLFFFSFPAPSPSLLWTSWAKEKTQLNVLASLAHFHHLYSQGLRSGLRFRKNGEVW